MAKWKVGSGCETYIRQLTELSMNTDEVLGKAIYQGAKIVTDAVRKSTEGLPVGETSYGKAGMVSTVTASQKKGLEAGLGISAMQNQNGYLNVKVGMDGYNTTKTKNYPNGQPNAMIARAIESGTSFRTKNPFISTATSATKSAAESAMQKELETQITKRIH